MNREVIKYKFNRNHVRIYTIQNPERSSLFWACPRYNTTFTYTRNKNVVDEFLNKKNKTGKDYEEIIKESPLGFYYKSKEYFPKENTEYNKCSGREIKTISFADTEGNIHMFTFYTQYGDNKAATTEDGLRPWEICEGDNSMPDHMINALWEEANSFFNLMEAYSIDKVYKTNGGNLINSNVKKDYNLSLVKKEVFEYLFGSVKGIRFQTDMEKIISHGFDPKYSFRNRKEKEKK